MKYKFIDPGKKQLIIGLIMSYVYIFSRTHVVSLLAHISGKNDPDNLGHHLTFLIRTIVLVSFIVFFRENSLLFIKDFKKSKFKDNFIWIMKGILYLIVIKAVYSTLLLLIKYLLHIDTTILFDGNSLNESSIVALLAAFQFYYIHVILLGPVGEEIVCRYILYHSFRKKGWLFAIILSSFIFGLCHVTGEFAQGMYLPGVYHLIGYMIPGIAFALIYEKRRNLTQCIILHMMNNLISTLI